MLESAVAPAYAALLLEAAQLLGPSQAFWQLLPAGQAGSIPQPWLRAAIALYAGLTQQPVLWSAVGRGCWLTPAQALLPDAACFVAGSSSTAGAQKAADELAGTADAASNADDDAGSGLEAGSAGAGALALGYVGGRLRPSNLAQLLVGCGVPLVMALSQEQQRWLLQCTPGTQQVRRHDMCCSPQPIIVLLVVYVGVARGKHCIHACRCYCHAMLLASMMLLMMLLFTL